MLELTEFERGWLAGVVDSEGNLVLGNRNDSTKHQLAIRIVNTNRDIIAECERLVPEGCVYVDEAKQEEWSNAYIFVIGKHDIIREVLTEIRGGLIEKQDQADILIKYINHREQSDMKRKSDGTFAKSTTSETEERLHEQFQHV